jgi:tripartite-type tricarboxylate transporter receptor subunit TctC
MNHPLDFKKGKPMKRRSFIFNTSGYALTSFVAVGSVRPAMAQTYPTKPIRLIVPFPAGGATDMTARIVAEPLSRILGQTVVVDNKGGAGGSIGTAELAKATPDGYTLGLATVSTHGVNPAVYKKLSYDAANDFEAISELVKAPGVMVAHASVPANNLADLIKYLKANPGKLTYASAGNGTIGHMWGELFKSTTNTFILHIPYRGAGAALNDMLSGQVQLGFDQLASSLPHIKSGKLKALAVSWPTRLEVLPQVPTFAEQALFSNNDASWFGLIAPRATPGPVVNRLQLAVAQALKEPSVRDRLTTLGLYPSASTPAEFSATIKKEINKMQRIAKFAKINLD